MRKQMAPAIWGPLKGLLFIIFLPLIGIGMIIALAINKLVALLRTSPKSASLDHADAAPRPSSRR